MAKRLRCDKFYLAHLKAVTGSRKVREVVADCWRHGSPMECRLVISVTCACGLVAL